jgi:hypothetical protein
MFYLASEPIRDRLIKIEKELASLLNREVKINKPNPSELVQESTELYLDQILAYLEEINSSKLRN